MTFQDPGWYPDPLNETARMRWFDGKEWGDATQPRLEKPAQATGETPTEQHDPAPTQAFSDPPATQQWGAAGPPPPPVKKSHRTAFIVGGIILVLLLIGGIASAVSNDKDASSSSADAVTSTTTTVVTPTVDPAVAAAQAASESAQVAAAASASAVAEESRRREAAAKVDRATYDEVGDRGWALVAKNPDAHIGEKIKLYGKVTQFDSATGTSQFLAHTEGVVKDEGYEYDVNTLVNEGISGTFDDVVEDDLVTLYATVTGSNTYKTQVGGETTVPELTAYVVDVTGSDR